jgi:cysteine synthase B
MVRINRMNPNPAVELYAKLEGFNPTGSIKDRIALKMIEQAEIDGLLTKDKIIIEATSGNTGIAIAMLAASLGYKAQLVMSDAVSLERQKLIKAFGAEVILTDGVLGTDGAIRTARELVAGNSDKYFYVDQYSNPNNPLSHESTANEILEQTSGTVTHFVSAVGTGGTLMGVGKRLRELNPNIKIIEVQPMLGHKIQGLKNMEEAIVPSIYSESHADTRIMVSDDDAFDAVRSLATKGILVGMSSGAAVFGALEIDEHDSTIVVMFPDDGMKYLSTNLF